MKAVEANLLRFLQGTNQFVIPIYQRTYSWSQRQCQQLWNDIVRAGQNPSASGHFLGSVVYIHEGTYQRSSVPQLLVIDGQQRLTTITLLLLALGRHLEDHPTEADITQQRIHNYYLLNPQETGNLRYKLLLTQSDKESLIRLIDGRELPSPYSTRVVENFRFFEQQIRNSGISPDTVFDGISHLMIVDISLDRDRDNPQLIFESLNSTGLDLSQADLIRNYVLMGLEPELQERLYTDYWYPMEQSFGHTEYSALFDRFMRDYLTVKSKSGAIPNINEVYLSFKSYVRNSQGVTIGDVVADVYRYSKCFVKLALGREEDKEINEVVGDINTLRVDVAYPFLLEVYDDYEAGRLSRQYFISILKLVESYVFRRAICGIPTNSLNKTFATISREIDKTDYLESTQRAFLRKDSYRRFPRDEEFCRELVNKDVYNFRNRNYLLGKLENHNHKERLDVSGCTIEHIMPQNRELSPAWQANLGPNWQQIQEKYLHTIGNLTLTGYNSELSDRPFTEKRDMTGGFKDSRIRLSAMLANLDHWNEKTIQARADELAQIAVKVWALPHPPEQVSHREATQAIQRIETVTLEDFLRNSPPKYGELFHLLRTRILNLDSSVKELIHPEHVSYLSPDTFVDVSLQKSRVRLVLNITPHELYDPRTLGEDVTGRGYWGGGNTLVGLDSPDDLDYVMDLVEQAYLVQAEVGVDAIL